MKLRLLSLIALITCLFIAGGVTFYFLLSPSVEPARVASNTTPQPITPAQKGPYYETLTIEEGDTLASVLHNLGISASQAQDATDAITLVFDPKELRVNQKIYIVYRDDVSAEGYDLLSLSFQPDFDFEIKLYWSEGAFEAAKIKKQLTHEHTAVKGVIHNSLYADALRAGASPKMLADMIKAFSYDVDFQRDIQPGTEFALFYDTYIDKESGLERPGELLYAQLIIEGTPHQIYRFQPKGGVPGYYSHKGEGIKKALLKTPIDGARLSSGFGNRRHPISGYTKMHKGVDFAAPRGTPIMAAGDGVVERCSRHGGYGNYICIRHAGSTKTAYAHLSRYAKNLKVGKKVNQGEIIGYVGTTGNSTGPHLHFELIQNGKHVNPQRITQLPTSKLAGKLLKEFQACMTKIKQMIKGKERTLRHKGI